MLCFTKKGAFLAAVFLLLFSEGFCVFAQQATLAASPAQNISESEIVLDSPANALDDQAQRPASSLWIFVRMVLVLGLVCAGIYAVVYLLKKSSSLPAADDPYLKSVSAVTLPPGKSVQVVTVGTRAFLLGITDQSIQLLCELTDQDLIDAMNLEADKRAAGPKKDFSALIATFLPPALRKVLSPKETSSSGTENSSASNPLSAIETGEFLKRQRARLQNREGQDE